MEILTNPHWEYFVLPTLPRMRDDCPQGLFDWILSETGGVGLSCDSSQIFAFYGMIDYEPPLMIAGPGVHPYLEFERVGTVTLHIAITVPSQDRESVVGLVLIADDKRHPVPLGDRTPSPMLEGSSAVRSARPSQGTSRECSISTWQARNCCRMTVNEQRDSCRAPAAETGPGA